MPRDARLGSSFVAGRPLQPALRGAPGGPGAATASSAWPHTGEVVLQGVRTRSSSLTRSRTSFAYLEPVLRKQRVLFTSRGRYVELCARLRIAAGATTPGAP